MNVIQLCRAFFYLNVSFCEKSWYTMCMEELCKTVLCDCHVALNAKLVDFAGWELPVQYTSSLEEHMAVRNACGIFDISHMGEFSLKGKDSKSLLEKLIPTSLSKLENSKGMYTMFCNEDGGVIDDIFIFQKCENDYYIVVNASRREVDFNWLKKHSVGIDIELIDESSLTAKIDLQGPASQSVLKKVFLTLAIPERFFFVYGEFEGKNVMISNTGYTGELGFELYCNNEIAEKLWNALLEKGKEFGLLPCGLASRDSLRLEASYSLYGHELSETINPIESSLGWAVSSEHDYIGCSILRAEKAEGVKRKIFCVKLNERGIPREGYRVQCSGVDIGYITSGCYSPFFKYGIAFALLDVQKAKNERGIELKIGQALDVIIREKTIGAVIAKRPFYEYNNTVK